VVYAAFNALMSNANGAQAVRLIAVKELETGMRLAGDIRTHDGLLLVGRGQVVSESLLARIRNFEHTTGLEERTAAIFEER
jgi:hypothetical protein